jgi:hypothetical protein
MLHFVGLCIAFLLMVIFIHRRYVELYVLFIPDLPRWWYGWTCAVYFRAGLE